MATKIHAEDPGLTRAVEKQLRRWEIAAGQCPDGGPAGSTCGYVALSNQVGAGGAEVAALLGVQLEWPVFDKQILHFMAGNDEVRERLYHNMDERDIGWLEEAFRALMQVEFRRNDYFHRLTETVLSLARGGPAIFLGRGTDLVLPPRRGLRVQVIAPRAWRVANFARRTGVSPDEAAVRIERIEQERRDFIRRGFRTDAEDPTRFDLLINMERFSAEDAAEVIMAALAARRA